MICYQNNEWIFFPLVLFFPLLKVIVPHECSSRFLKCANGTKSSKASHVINNWFSPAPCSLSHSSIEVARLVFKSQIVIGCENKPIMVWSSVYLNWVRNTRIAMKEAKGFHQILHEFQTNLGKLICFHSLRKLQKKCSSSYLRKWRARSHSEDANTVSWCVV